MAVHPEILPDSTPLLKLTHADTWTVGDSYEGTQILGANGSGKTSGSGQAIALRMLTLGYGGLVLTVKNDDDFVLWCDPVTGYLAKTGRTKDLIVLEDGGLHCFDFLQYEFTRPGQGAGNTLELSRLFTTVLEAAGSGGIGQSDAYWSEALNQLVTNTIDLAKFATGQVSLFILSKIIHSAPLSIEATRDWEWERVVDAAKAHASTDQEKRDLDITLDYFNWEFPRLGDRLRSSIVSLFTSMADKLLRGTVGTLFSGGKVTLTPEQTHDGKIILINLPTKQFGETGRFAQMIFKHVWQKAAERRDKSKPMRPVFLWCDESQEFFTSHDATFQATARSSRVATVYLTQNIRLYHARMGGGPKAEADTDSLLGNLNTKIFQANGEPTTNQWAEKTFGLEWVTKVTTSPSGNSESLATESRVMASLFTMLKTGKEQNGYIVGSFAFMTGRKWNATDCNAIYVEFAQNSSAEPHRNMTGLLIEEPRPPKARSHWILGIALGIVILSAIVWSAIRS